MAVLRRWGIPNTSHVLDLAFDLAGPPTRLRAERRPGVCVCAGWHRPIDPEVLDIPTAGFIGFHASRLPAGRGGAPITWSLITGAPPVWLSMFWYDAGIDTGPVIDQAAVSVEPRDDVGMILEKLGWCGMGLLDALPYPHLAAVRGTPQSPQAATYRPRRQPQDGLLLWDRPATALSQWVRGLTRPYPGAYTFIDGHRITVWSAEARSAESVDAAPGQIVDVVDGAGVDVATERGILRLKRVRIDEGLDLWADALPTHCAVAPGQRFTWEAAPPEWCYTGLRRMVAPKPFDSALQVGQRGSAQLFALSAAGTDVTIRLDGRPESEHRVDSSRWTAPVGYAFDTAGIHTVVAEFERPDGTRDLRRLTVVVHP